MAIGSDRGANDNHAGRASDQSVGAGLFPEMPSNFGYGKQGVGDTQGDKAAEKAKPGVLEQVADETTTKTLSAMSEGIGNKGGKLMDVGQQKSEQELRESGDHKRAEDNQNRKDSIADNKAAVLMGLNSLNESPEARQAKEDALKAVMAAAGVGIESKGSITISEAYAMQQQKKYS